MQTSELISIMDRNLATNDSEMEVDGPIASSSKTTL
jgi:hypothetical protein